MKKFVVLLPFMVLFLVGFIRDTPVHVARVNLKLSDNEIAITFLALSNGEATLIQHAEAGNILLNTGGPGTREELKELLRMYNITDLHSVIMTNDQKEYNHNLDWVVSNYSVDEVIVGSESPRLVAKLNYPKVTYWGVGEHYELLPNLIVHVVHEHHNARQNGIDISLKYGNHHILYMSSADITIERALAKLDLKDVNILKVADFASNIGTSQTLLDSVDPQVAVIFKKKGSLPSQDVLERLHDTWIDIYQTSQYGNVSIKFGPNKYDIITIH